MAAKAYTKNVPFQKHVFRLSSPLHIGLSMPYSLGEMCQKRLSFGTSLRARRWVASEICAYTGACPDDEVIAAPGPRSKHLFRILDRGFREFQPSRQSSE